MPRFLVRLPYGAKTDACELIAFEEMGEEYDHERLLWGNPAIACAALLAASFGEDGWSMRPGKHSNLDGLPTYVYQRDGDFVAQPCAETIMTERAAKAIQDCGVMCLASIKDTDEVRLVRFQCSSKVVGPLNGPWTHV
jgi:type VI secretion system protein ImpC